MIVPGFIILFFGYLFHYGVCMCYFPVEFQGVFVTQSTLSASDPIRYSEVVVLPDSIPVWGICHKRFGKNVILHDRTGGTDCIRCFHLSLRSPNVLQVHMEELYKCYTNEEVARATCPTTEMVERGQAREIMLYRTKVFGEKGDVQVKQEYCPINGRFTFTYNQNTGGEAGIMTCTEPTSELSNCPYGFGLTVRFRRCTFGEMDMAFQCLGEWKGGNGESYLALLDTQATDVARPRYRCAMYRKDKKSGRVYVALSSDSTCLNDLVSAETGFQTLVLNPIPTTAWPLQVEHSSCKFPKWSYGEWEDLTVSGNTLVFRDRRIFKTFTTRCIGQELGIEEEKFMVFARSECGEEYFTCIWLKKRGINVMEFQQSMSFTNGYNDTLCNSDNFQETTWLAQGKISVFEESPCPISGEYRGVIPDAIGLCAKLFSDCNNPEIMFYRVFDCYNTTLVYEEREYRCLGQWEENSVMFTYTQRRDVPGYECFVGTIRDPINDQSVILISEAGTNCQRLPEPLRKSMKLKKEASCYLPPVTRPTTTTKKYYPTRTTWFTTRRPVQKKTTKSWRPITEPPGGNAIDSCSQTTVSLLCLYLSLVISRCLL